MRTVLLVSYTFPPQYDVSGRRAAKLCKYLPAAGWRPIVLTKDWEAGAAPEDARAYSLAMHPEALDELDGVEIIRTPYRARDNALRRLHQRLTAGARVTKPPRWTPGGMTRRALSLLSPAFGDFPDAFRGWADFAVPLGVEAVRRGHVDAILSLCPPATAHVVASEIARRTGLPWVTQFDDLYSFHLERQRRAAWRHYTDRQHRDWMSRATFAGAITPAMLAYVRRTYGVDGDVVVVGFDPDDDPRVERQHRDRLRLVYTGSVYPGDQRPEILFEALDRVVRADASDASPFEMVFVGTGRDADLQAMLQLYPAAATVCRFESRVPPAEALRLQRGADALVMLNCTAPSPEEGTLSFPAKTFEYLNAGRPILAIPCDPGGWGDQLLERTRAGETAGSAGAAAAILTRWLATWRRTGVIPYAADRPEIDRYSVPRQAGTLARLLDEAMARTSRQALPRPLALRET